MQNNKFDQRLAQLPAQIAPTTELWPDLAAKLAGTPQQVQFTQQGTTEQGKTATVAATTSWWYGMAAAVLLSVLSWWQWPVAQQPALNSPLAAQPAATTRPSVTAFADDVARPTLEQADWQLISLFETDKARLLKQLTAVPAAYGDWQQQLAIWQQASRQIQHALRYQPNEPVLLRQLQRVQQQQLAYLQKLVQSDMS